MCNQLEESHNFSNSNAVLGVSQLHSNATYRPYILSYNSVLNIHSEYREIKPIQSYKGIKYLRLKDDRINTVILI